MTPMPKSPVTKTVTVKAKTKKRYTVVVDDSLLSLMRAVGRKLDFVVGTGCVGSGELTGAFLLPANNVMEIYVDPNGNSVGYLFTNLDVWLSFGQSIDAS